MMNDSNEYFIKAKDLVTSILNQDEYKNRNERDVLKTVDFNKKVIAKVSEYIKGVAP